MVYNRAIERRKYVSPGSHSRYTSFVDNTDNIFPVTDASRKLSSIIAVSGRMSGQGEYSC